MIASPLIQELFDELFQEKLEKQVAERTAKEVAERIHKCVLSILTHRFQSVPSDIITALQPIQEEHKLDELAVWAGRWTDLAAFRSRLSQ